MNESVKQFNDYVTKLLAKLPEFTGSLQLNWKDGVLMDIHETKRTKIIKGTPCPAIE